MNIPIPWKKHLPSFNKIGTKGKKEELRSQDTKGNCWWTDKWTETCTPKSPMIKHAKTDGHKNKYAYSYLLQTTV